MAIKLQNVSSSGKALDLKGKQAKFKLTFSEKLDNGFELKDMDNSTIKEFHRFVSDTIYKSLSISDVENLYLRDKDSNLDEGSIRNSIHLGKDRNKFRLFGYYNTDGYFVINRIDGKHKTHKS